MFGKGLDCPRRFKGCLVYHCGILSPLGVQRGSMLPAALPVFMVLNLVSAHTAECNRFWAQAPQLLRFLVSRRLKASPGSCTTGMMHSAGFSHICSSTPPCCTASQVCAECRPKRAEGALAMGLSLVYKFAVSLTPKYFTCIADSLCPDFSRLPTLSLSSSLQGIL